MKTALLSIALGIAIFGGTVAGVLVPALAHQHDKTAMHTRTQSFASQYNVSMDFARRTDGRYCSSIHSLNQVPKDATVLEVIQP